MKTLNFLESKRIIEKFGIKFAPSHIVKNIQDAKKAANTIGYPIVLKVISDDISHKTDVGGVITGIRNEKSLIENFDKIMKNCSMKTTKIKGILVQKMVEGIEILIGGKKDPKFGQIVVFGLGGIYVEIMKDVSLRVAPINKNQALDMMSEIKGFKILKGFRGKTYDINKVANIISKVSNMLHKNGNIFELDLNPLIVMEKDVLAVDVRIVLDG